MPQGSAGGKRGMPWQGGGGPSRATAGIRGCPGREGRALQVLPREGGDADVVAVYRADLGGDETGGRELPGGDDRSGGDADRRPDVVVEPAVVEPRLPRGHAGRAVVGDR